MARREFRKQLTLGSRSEGATLNCGVAFDQSGLRLESRVAGGGELPLAYLRTAASHPARLRRAAPSEALLATVNERFMIRDVPSDCLAKLTSGHVMTRVLPSPSREEPELDQGVPGTLLASIEWT